MWGANWMGHKTTRAVNNSLLYGKNGDNDYVKQLEFIGSLQKFSGVVGLNEQKLDMGYRKSCHVHFLCLYQKPRSETWWISKSKGATSKSKKKWLFLMKTTLVNIQRERSLLKKSSRCSHTLSI